MPSAHVPPKSYSLFTSRTRTCLPQTHTAPARGGVSASDPGLGYTNSNVGRILTDDPRSSSFAKTESDPPTPPKKARVLCTPRPSSGVWLVGAVILDHRHCQVAEAVRFLTLMVKTLGALPRSDAPFLSIRCRHVGPLDDVEEDTAHEVRSHTLFRAMQPIDPETTGPQPRCSKNGTDRVASTRDAGQKVPV